MQNKDSAQLSYRDFMRARRPELYSDSLTTENTSMDSDQFEFYLDTLTQRKQETSFEHFARLLAEKELCPNLLPQTGPTGGGDSKVDTETYPVADAIADRWYEGNARQGASERWAFAISAKKAWKPKIESDVQKIIETGRPYSLIYFITNQSVSDKKRAETEDALTRKWGKDIRILDRTWIVKKVTENRRWGLVSQTLGLQSPRVEKSISLGPNDAERVRELAELDTQIEDVARYQGVEYQLTEDCLRSALLARGLAHHRTEIDGRFERALRFARQRGDERQQRQILYQRAWTAIWWFDDIAEASHIYDQIAADALQAEWVWEIENIVNLWLTLAVRHLLDESSAQNSTWVTRTSALRAALARHAEDSTRPTNSLWARTQLVMMDLAGAAQDRARCQTIYGTIREIFEQARGLIDFPAEPLIRIVRELGQFIDDDEPYDDLLEIAIALQKERHGNADEGRMRLERGKQKLHAGKMYDAIDQCAKAQMLLAQEEQRDEFIVALACTAMAYEAAGLLWAARANMVIALDRCLYKYQTDGQIDGRALLLLRRLVWLEIQLGRVPYVLCWMEWLKIATLALNSSNEKLKDLLHEAEAVDLVLGILILRTKFTDWANLGKISGVLEKYSLLMSSCAALFMLGQTARLKLEIQRPDENLDEVFTGWLMQPAANDLPPEAQWQVEANCAMQTSLFGCKVTVTSRGGGNSALVAESLLAFFESFFSTALQLKSCFSPRPELAIEVRQTEQGQQLFGNRISEDECGETRIIVSHSPVAVSNLVMSEGFQDAIFELLARVVAELQLNLAEAELKTLFEKHRAQDRAFLAARSVISLKNVLGETPKYRAADWNDLAECESFVPTRIAPWKPISLAVSSNGSGKQKRANTDALSDSPLFGIDGLKHRDLSVISPINMPLWDKAKWRGLGFFWEQDYQKLFRLLFIFSNPAEGLKIFRGWQKKIGCVDIDSWIGLTIITGIDRQHPMHYRVTVSIDDDYLKKHVSNKNLFMAVSRIQDMTPSNNENLNAFLTVYGKMKRFKIQLGDPNRSDMGIEKYADLGIELTKVKVIPAWKIERHSILAGAMRANDTPFIPADVVDAPVLATLEWLRNPKK